MSYRHRIYKVPKAFVEEAYQCKNMDDFYEVYIKYCHKDVHIAQLKKELSDGGCYPLFYIGQELFDYGDRSEVVNEMYPHSTPLFSSEELTNRYDHYKPAVMSDEGVVASIEWMKNLIVGIYEDLLREESNVCWKKSIDQFTRMKQHIASVLDTWKPEFGDYTAYNLSKTTDEIVSSWLWEHQIWDLVRIYKTFDWNNYAMIFYGW